ncbi:uncharacterized protein [Periplaneta americana]|uniref:uncharacterized protein n=1 Tax=Periplaneta americana TaxID=6978 RepID=UPI0037E8D062
MWMLGNPRTGAAEMKKFTRWLHLLMLLEACFMFGETLEATNSSIVEWKNDETAVKHDKEFSFYPFKNVGTVVHSDAGFHDKIFPGIANGFMAFEDEEQKSENRDSKVEAEIRYEPDEVSDMKHGWEAVLNMQPEEDVVPDAIDKNSKRGEQEIESIRKSVLDRGFEMLPGFEVVDSEDEWGAELHGTCDCWNTTEDGRDVEVECRCGGLELTDIPNNLASDVHRITVVHAGMTVLKEGALQHYRETLREIEMHCPLYPRDVDLPDEPTYHPLIKRQAPLSPTKPSKMPPPPPELTHDNFPAYTNQQPHRTKPLPQPATLHHTRK